MEVFLEFSDPIEHDGQRYVARACGRERPEGLWEGWIEFEPLGGGAPIRSGRETTQPNRETARYWATGLTYAYLEGALERALERERGPSEPRGAALFEHTPPRGPAAPVARTAGAVHAPPPPQSVLDPFAVYAEGRDVLRDQLGALDADHLRNIIRAHRLHEGDAAELAGLTDWELRALILRAVEQRSPT